MCSDMADLIMRQLNSLFLTAVLVVSAAAQETNAPVEFWSRDQLTGDWGGARSAVKELGVDFTFEYDAQFFSVVSGGVDRGAAYMGLGYAAMDMDLEKLVGWGGGKFFASAMWLHGESPGQYIGNELAVSNIDAYDGVRLHEMYLGQDIGNLRLKAGSLLAEDDFVESVYRDILINDAFGPPASWSANTLNAGPTFQSAGLGIHVRYDITRATYVQAGIYDGDIFDNAAGDPAINQHGVHFELGKGQGWTSLYQIGYNGFEVSDGTDLPGWYRLGAWHHSAQFEQHDGSTTEGNGGIIASIDQMVYRELGDQGLGSFLRFGVAERDRSRFHWTLDTGLNYAGLFPGRDEDVIALGIVYAKHSSAITTTRSHETMIELAYQYQLTPAIYLQPDIQWISRPSGDNSIGDAWVIGLRAGFTF